MLDQQVEDGFRLCRLTGSLGTRSGLIALSAAAMLAGCGGGGGGGGGGGAPGGGGGGPINPSQPEVVGVDVVFPGYATDAIWDERQQVLYLALPSEAGPNGNSIVALDPRANRVVRSQFAGSDPTVLAVSDDGQYLYAGLQGSASIRRFRLPDLEPDLTIPLAADVDGGPSFAVDLAVVPGSPRSVVAALSVDSLLPDVSSTVVFDDAVPRPQTLGQLDCSCSTLQLASATQLFAANNETTGYDFYDIAIDESGLRLNNHVREAFSMFGIRIHYSPDTRLLYSDDGIVFDPVAVERVAHLGTRGPMVPDTGRNLLYFAESDGGSRIAAYDATTYEPVGVPRKFSEQAQLNRLVRWGLDGLALTTRFGPVHLFGGGGVSSFETAVPTGAASQILIAGTFNDIAWSPAHQRLYASTSNASADSPSSILVIDPTTGEMTPHPMTDEPGALAVSDDGQFLYVGLSQGFVQRLRLPTLEVDITFAIGSDDDHGPYVAHDLAVAPGSPRTVAVVRTVPDIFPVGLGGVQIFDDATPRPSIVDPHMYGADEIEWNPDGSTLYAMSFLGSDLHVFALDDAGLHLQQHHPRAFHLSGRIKVDRDDGLIYHDSGRAVDPATGRPTAIFRRRSYAGSQLLTSDRLSNRLFVLSLPSELGGLPNHQIDVYDLSRHTPAIRYPVTIGAIPWDFIRCGANDFAIRALDGIYIVRLDSST